MEQFGQVILRANADGSTVRLKDVARIELGAQSYATSARLNGNPSTGIGVQLSPTGNALATAAAVKARLDELQRFFPEGVSVSIPYDSSRFVKISIQQVVVTLLEAVVLVFLVMYLFLQNWRATVIPTIVVPVALLGTFGVLLALGFSINVLTMFGMVLVIGIVVDDAIVVVENVERIMSEEGLPPRQATRKAMGQISGAIIGVTVVLIAVFVPLAFFAGSVGNIYRQFSAVMVASIALSAFMALSLTPALCATLLQPVQAGHNLEKRGFFGAFNRFFRRTSEGYEGWVGAMLRKSGRWLVVYVAIVGALAVMYTRLPTSFLPAEDQGNLLVNVQLPPGATQERTRAVMQQVEAFMLQQPEVESMVGVLGFSFSGQGQNAALAFVTLKDWDQRPDPQNSAQALAGRAFGALMGIRDAFVFPLSPPPIPELGTASGFSLRLQDRGGVGRETLLAARNQLLGMASQSKVVTQVRPDGLEDAPQLQVDVDRDKAAALGVGFDAINATLSAALGSAYVNDFPNAGRLQRVVVQADAPARMQAEDLLRLTVTNARGQPVPLSAFASTRWVTGAMQAVRYNGYPAMRIGGSAAPGFSTGDAMAEMERLVAQLPQGIGYEWTGISREEKLAGAQALVLYGFAILAVFLPVPGGAVRELEHPVCGDPGGAAGRAGRGAGHPGARAVERRVLPGRPRHHHRPGGQERDPHHRVRQGPAGPGAGCRGVGADGSAAAFPAHRDDVHGLHPGRGPALHRQRRGFGQPARHRHRRDRRHAHGGGAGGVFRAAVFRRGAQGVQGQRAPAPAARARRRTPEPGRAGGPLT